MGDGADFDLQKDPSPAPPPAPRRSGPVWWAIAAVVVIAAAAALVFLRRTDPPAPEQAGMAATDVPVGPVTPLGADVEPIDLPPLDESDMVVRDLVRALSTHPSVAAWLTTDGLIRNFTVVVENVAAGRTPSGRLRVLKPAEPFAVADAGGTVVVDPRSYARYNGIAAAAASVDPQGAARLYAMLKPRIEEAWAEIGTGPFDRALETAIVKLLEVPAPDGEIALVPKGGVFHYNDTRIERLTQAQKQLVRMGPRNVRTVQQSLRNIALALGIPPERLPPPAGRR